MGLRLYELMLLIVATIALVELSAAQDVSDSCKAKIDVGFILDSSGSLRNDYQKEKDFLNVLASRFGFSKDGARASVLTFSYFSELTIKFNDYFDLDAFRDAVNKIPLMGSTTRIDRAFRLTQKEMFLESNGARPDVRKILILLTDGTQTQDADAEDPGNVANELRASGIDVIVIGIGPGTNQTELNHMAGGPDNAYSASSFDELIGGQFITKLAQKTCKVATSCKVKVDVGFILDSSGSLRNDYDNEKYFLKTLVDVFGVSKDGSRVSVLTFSYYAELSIKFKDHFQQDSFNDAVDKIPLMGSTTRIDKALRLTQKEMFLESNGARPGVPKILILLTDGTQTQDAGAEDPGNIANELRATGINVIVIGIGPGTNQTELNHMAGGPDNAYSASSFDELIGDKFVTKLRTKTCNVGSKKTPSTTYFDLGIIVDASIDVKADFKKLKSFISKLSSNFVISSKGNHAGIILYNTDASL